jgi:hypothetical protein
VFSANPETVGSNNQLPSANPKPSSSSSSRLVFVQELRNATKEVGDTHKLRCEARGDPPVTAFRWYKNEAPLIEEQQRLRVRDYLKPSSDSGGQSSILRFKELETLDTGFYRCEATNGLGETIKSTAVLKVNLGSGKYHRSGGGGGGLDEDDYVHLPSSFQDPFEELDNAFGGGGGGGGGGGEGGGLASQIEFQAGVLTKLS